MSRLRVPKIAEVVADTIRGRIISGELTEGDSLPPEAQLVEQFGVSRPTLREAFRILETERLIAVTRGSRSGARVSRPMAETVARYASYVLQADGVTVADIFEARLAIEPYAVRKLATCPDVAVVDRLRAEVARQSDHFEKGREADVLADAAEFHRVLMELAGNETLHFLARVLQGVVTQTQLRLIARWPEEAERRAALGLSVRSFGKLVDLIEAGDADAAERHWRLHLTNINKAWASGRTLREILGN